MPQLHDILPAEDGRGFVIVTTVWHDGRFETEPLGEWKARYSCFATPNGGSTSLLDELRLEGWSPSPEQAETVPLDRFALRWIVGRWLRIRASHVQGTPGRKDELRALFTQLAADAEHSDLLARLFAGENPLPYNEWVARGRHG